MVYIMGACRWGNEIGCHAHNAAEGCLGVTGLLKIASGIYPVPLPSLWDNYSTSDLCLFACVATPIQYTFAYSVATLIAALP